MKSLTYGCTASVWWDAGGGVGVDVDVVPLVFDGMKKSFMIISLNTREENI